MTESCSVVSTSVMRTIRASVRSLTPFSMRSISMRTSIASPAAADIFSLTSSSASWSMPETDSSSCFELTVELDEAVVDGGDPVVHHGHRLVEVRAHPAHVEVDLGDLLARLFLDPALRLRAAGC